VYIVVREANAVGAETVVDSGTIVDALHTPARDDDELWTGIKRPCRTKPKFTCMGWVVATCQTCWDEPGGPEMFGSGACLCHHQRIKLSKGKMRGSVPARSVAYDVTPAVKYIDPGRRWARDRS
jgi:hypothetical protein